MKFKHILFSLFVGLFYKLVVTFRQQIITKNEWWDNNNIKSFIYLTKEQPFRSRF